LITASSLLTQEFSIVAEHEPLVEIEPILILVYSQVTLSLLLPLPLLPLLIFTKDKKLMGTFVNRKITTILAGIFIGTIILLNALFLYLSFGGRI
jgi:manganese transport protein